MRIMTLNTWGGRAGKQQMLDFFAKHKDTVDIFCLQEIWSAPYEHMEGRSAGGMKITNDQIMVYGLQEITKILPGFRPFFHPHHGDHYGLLMMINNKLQVLEEGEFFVHMHKGYVPQGDLGNHARNVQFVRIPYQDKNLTVMNFHGLWNGKGKTDSDERLSQSQNILNFINDRKISGEIILCGDFNLLPETQSIKMLEDAGLRNMIKDYDVKSTRTSFYSKPEKFADYIFVSPQMEIKSFSVLPDEVSDHAPLLLEI